MNTDKQEVTKEALAQREELLTTLRGEHGEVHSIHSKDGAHEVIARLPSRPEWKRFMAQSRKKDENASEILLLGCIVHPDKAGQTALFARYPALVDSFSAKLCELAGLDEVE